MKEYLGLYERYNEDEDCKQRLGGTLSRYSGKKTLGREIKALIERDYSMIAGEKVREMFASDILRLLEQRQDYAMNIDSGQVMWLGVKREERQNYGKNASPLILR